MESDDGGGAWFLMGFFGHVWVRGLSADCVVQTTELGVSMIKTALLVNSFVSKVMLLLPI